ncbi:hypothetical protein O181_001210 [Austropuccinia psidii MF-1]|uniref:Integrase zinc-binding domain-containing protein n=1 Tax=Austropuccinia psidii MF-1 TaxID=1389203 RepID=A0A9Q3BA79_9BASI|nr:hypothetical protein [Austropuccinia psidii MF-1]
MSEDRTKERTESTAWWPQWEQELREYINTCERCQKANRRYEKKEEFCGSQTLRGVFQQKPSVSSLIKPYHQAGENKFPSRNKTHSTQEIVKVEDSHDQVKKIMISRKIRLNGKDHKQYLVRFKNHTDYKDKYLAEDSIPDCDLHLRILRASGWA